MQGATRSHQNIIITIFIVMFISTLTSARWSQILVTLLVTNVKEFALS